MSESLSEEPKLPAYKLVAANPNQRVTSVKQSPLNSRRWCLSLECGHEVWITAENKPRRKFAPCSRWPHE
jgi:hypothetical protein